MIIVKVLEGGVFGVVIFVGVGVGIYEFVEDVCNRIVKGKEKVNLNIDLKDLYLKIYEIYNLVYFRIKDI